MNFTPALHVLAAVFSWQLLISTALSVLGRFGRTGRGAAAFFSRAPGLDVAVSALTWVPWVAGAAYAGWIGFAAAVLAQVAALGVWIVGHEWANREHLRGPRIVTVINRTVGRWRNHAALWVTAISLPVFVLIRFAEVFTYPLLIRLLGFPRYNHAEWVNISRQKFQGLVGHDLVWCLYCDWMTGVYALGAEMLRNVESFWCPIRFASGVKCENCKLDFPDVARGWVPADGTMADVERTLETHYGSGRREWFNHPARLTVRGESLPDRGPGESRPATEPVASETSPGEGEQESVR